MSISLRNRKSDNTPRVNKAAKSLLAKLLATEDIRVVHSARVTTATWSGRTRTLTLPIWKHMTGDIYDMLVCHEVGHVLYTPDENSAETNKALKRLTQGKSHLRESAFGFLNICEDARIEKKMKTRFPGSRVSFSRGYKWLSESGTIRLPANLNEYKFIDRVNMFFKLGPIAAESIQFDSQERPLVDALADANTFDDMVDVAEAMYRLAQEQKSNQPPPPAQGEGGEPQPHDGEEEPKQDSCNTDIPDDPNKNGPKDTRSSDDDTDDGESADSTDGDGKSRGESSDGKTDRDSDKSDSDSDSDSKSNKPEDKDESSDTNPDGKSNDSGDKDGSESDETESKSSDSDSDSGSDSGDEDGSESDETESKSSDSDSGSDSGDEDAADEACGGRAQGGAAAPDSEGGKSQGCDDNSLTAPDSPETSSGLDEAVESLVDRNATDLAYVNVPEMILKNIIQDHKQLHKEFQTEMGSYSYEGAVKMATKDLTEFEKEAKPVVGSMAKRFDMMKAADQHRRAMTAKTGRINPDMLHAYKLTEDIFMRQTRVANGKNHGLVMFIDWSGSMSGNMSKTIKQLLNLVLFCRRVNIPFEVFSFTDFDHAKGPSQVQKEGDFRLSGFTLHNWLSGRMSAREFKRAMLHMMMLCRHFGCGRSSSYGYYRRRRSRSRQVHIPSRFTLGGTPLDDCIVAAMDIVPAFQKANDVQIVNTIFLTDGASNGSPIFNNNTGAGYGGDLVVHDPQTRQDFILSDFDHHRCGYNYSGSRNATALLLTMLRERTASNVIGFYLLDTHRGSTYGRNTIASKMGAACREEIDAEWKRFQTDNFAIATSSGYSEYYILPAKLDAVTKELTDGSAEALTSMSRSKRVNRVMLNRFIDMIARER